MTLQSIGFTFANAADFRKTVERLAGEAPERLACPFGDYAIWRSRSGAELWFHLAAPEGSSQEREIAGLTPFFEGRSEVPLSQLRRLQPPDDTAFECSLSACVLADGGDGGQFPIIFDVVDAAVWPASRLPQKTTARLTGFASALAHYASEADFIAANAGRAGVTAQAFLPAGLAAAATANGERDAAMALSSTACIRGRVIEHARLRNEATGQAFSWLFVESCSARVDIVADPDLVRGPITPGATVDVTCWLVGRILD